MVEHPCLSPRFTGDNKITEVNNILLWNHFLILLKTRETSSFRFHAFSVEEIASLSSCTKSFINSQTCDKDHLCSETSLNARPFYKCHNDKGGYHFFFIKRPHGLKMLFPMVDFNDRFNCISSENMKQKLMFTSRNSLERQFRFYETIKSLNNVSKRSCYHHW